MILLAVADLEGRLDLTPRETGGRIGAVDLAL